MPIDKRIFIGNLNNQIDASLEDLGKRFKTFGNVITSFEKGSNFAHVNMSFEDEKNFNDLKRNFNNLKFKGNLLKIDIAKPDWQHQWKLQREKDAKDNLKLEKVAKKKDWEFYKKIENVNKTWKDRRDVMDGRIRKTPRTKQTKRNVTFRIDVNGSLKVYKCYKTKLWGYEKNKELQDLVYKFVGSKWRNGNDHIVDKLDYSRSRNLFTLKLTKIGNESVKGSTDASKNIENEGEYEALEKQAENEKIHDALTNVLNDLDLEKPIDIVDSDDDFDFNSNVTENDSNNKRAENNYENGQYNQNHDDNYNEHYEEQEEYYEENEQYPKEQEDKYPEEEIEKEESEEEFIPTFAATPVQPVEGTISNTDNLRSLFNPEEQKSDFMLAQKGNEDIDESKTFVDEQIQDSKEFQENLKASAQQFTKFNQKHLFFPHLRSPFLIGQTQLTKVTASINRNSALLENWENEFWDNRGNWMREMKQKKKDAVRSLNRRRGKGKDDILI
ncbi:hypothetical protein TPHA_0A00280 [Tetrapisispora phaffii CBS 4417]|uniref:RRM domain-containing protein n=1 Tax=Tetrapisispora phaffii (strain ATCC 24235 / CBS 4417 / NBRC 1672 / NRRL Y-8282 / UCD 70-5) TaxID=1071381 RepID=G8BMI5_TETPH|nr:hypothetical protein TPHA_0A00280 [Tetrapisispora phaffii CBS 4417]CCE61113.1 hypothetical protein TPHA_0A00280 [Tetrapisispora phaffii CBS 4417]